MNRKSKIGLAGASVIALAAGGVGVASATGDGGDRDVASAKGDDGGRDVPIRGSALDRARDAAIEHIGGGQVTETEVGDEESYYEVEVTRSDGSQVDVQLDRQFNVVGDEADDESATDED